MTTETWTPADEYRLRTMQERKDRVLAARRKPVEDLVRAMPARAFDEETVTSWLIDYAEAMRDALAPFDSGVRAAPAEGD